MDQWHSDLMVLTTDIQESAIDFLHARMLHQTTELGEYQFEFMMNGLPANGGALEYIQRDVSYEKETPQEHHDLVYEMVASANEKVRQTLKEREVKKQETEHAKAVKAAQDKEVAERVQLAKLQEKYGVGENDKQ